MARKRRKRRARKSRSNPKRKVQRRKKRRHVANPRRRRRVRRAHANPRRRFKRRHRRNPNIPLWGQVLLAGVAGVAGYAAINAGSFALTQKIDPTMLTLERNRNIVAGASVLGGVALAIKGHPFVGVALAAAGACSGLGTFATLKLGSLLSNVAVQPSAPKTAVAAVYGQDMQAVYGQDMQGYQQMGSYQPMGQVYGQDMRGIVEYRPSPPWSGRGPF